MTQKTSERNSKDDNRDRERSISSRRTKRKVNLDLTGSRPSSLLDSYQLRTATFIVPKTGERVKRAFTLRNLEDSQSSGDTCGPVEDDEDEDDDNEERGHEHEQEQEERVSMADVTSPLLPRKEPRRLLSGAGPRKRAAAGDLSSQNVEGRLRKWRRELVVEAKAVWDFATSTTGKGVLKCSLAYLLGSMATFIPFLAGLLGHQDGKHMVATVTVYFHPARSQGSMFEAVFMAIGAFLYATFISFTSMGVSVLFDDYLDMIEVGHLIVLIVFCGGGLGLVGWMKQRLGNPLVNVACSLTSLAIITVLTKEEAVLYAEFSDDKIAQVLKMISMGVLATTAICFLIAPISARKNLRQNMIEATDSYSDMLAMITRGFLTGSEEEMEQRGFEVASNRYKELTKSLTKNLQEAKWEHLVLGTEGQYQLQRRLVSCMTRLAHDLGGLRSAATTQFKLLAEPVGGGVTPMIQSYTPTTAGIESDAVGHWMNHQETYAALAAIAEQPEEEEIPPSARRHASQSEDSMGGSQTIRTPIEIFERFLMHLGPSMKSLAFTVKQILDDLPYGPAPRYKIAVNSHFKPSLSEALELYRGARKQALSQLYKGKDLNHYRPKSVEADYEEVAASCGYFSFSLQDFAEDVKTYLDILEELKLENEKPYWKRSWNWLKFWRRQSTNKKAVKTEDDAEHANLIVGNEEPDSPTLIHSPSGTDTFHFTGRKPRKVTLTYRIWKATTMFRRDDVKYAIKVGAGAAIYALPSFLWATRPIYAHWKGEWGLLSYMLVCSMTIGASNTVGFQRFAGTCLGAICAIIAWIISDGNAIALAFLGWLMSLWTSYIIVAKDKGPLGRYIMLTYNLSALFAYSVSIRDDQDTDDPDTTIDPVIGEIALHRVVAVLSGCLWGLVITRLIWPISARRKFKDGLSLLLLRMGLIWKRDPLTTLLEDSSKQITSQPRYMDLREEFQLQQYIRRLEVLRVSASAEFELKGPFPSKEFNKILQSMVRMLDSFHAMNNIIMKDPQASSAEADILRYTAAERAELCSRISHLFQVLASSVKLEFPLGEGNLPSTRSARDRLLARIFRFRREMGPNGRWKGSLGEGSEVKDEDFALLYAFSLVTGQIADEIENVASELEYLYGIVDEDSLKLQ